MLPHRSSSRIVVSVLLLVLIVGAPIGLALAQAGQPQTSGELLTNPGFEPPFVQLGTADIFVASGWTGWWVTPDNVTYPSDCPPGSPATCKPYRVPVYRNSQPQDPRIPPRARSGNSQQWGISFAVYVAGVYQRVANITPGTRLRFSAYLQGFNCSDDRGCFGGFGEYGKSYEPGDMRTRVGIDPSGGTNPFGSSVVWSAYQNPLDAFSLHQVEAVAQGNAVTVFLWSSPTFPEKHTDIYVDDASLVAIGQGPAPATTAPGTQPPAGTPPAGAGTYTIKEGDTLFAIALQFNLTLDQLLALNPGLTRDSLLQIGQVINVGGPANVTPATVQATAQLSPTSTPTTAAIAAGGPITYTVQAGDTLFALALQFNLTLDQLLALNNISKDTPLVVGQVLTVGVAAVTATPTPTSTLTPTLVTTPTVTPTPAASTSGLCLLAFDDQNGDGQQNANEPLLAGVQFDVKSADGRSVASYTSDGVTEPHCIGSLPDGRYTVDVTPPANRQATSEAHWSLSLLSGASVNVTFGSQSAPAATATPEVTPTATAEAAGRGAGASLGLLAGGVLILLAAAALAFGLRARRK